MEEILIIFETFPTLIRMDIFSDHTWLYLQNLSYYPQNARWVMMFLLVLSLSVNTIARPNDLEKHSDNSDFTETDPNCLCGCPQ